MKKRLSEIGTLPVWGLFIGGAFVLLQGAVYGFALYLSRVLGTSALAFSPKIPVIDDLFPIVPFFTVFYLLSFIYWAVGAAAVAITGKRRFINYLIGLTLSFYLTFLILLIFPTYIDRVAEGSLQIAARQDIFSRLLTFVYNCDGGERGYNLLPSFHCLASVYCYLGIRKRPEISRGYRFFSLIMSLLVCLSTLLTKQHYFIDFVSGSCIAIFCYAVISNLDPGKVILDHYAAKKISAEKKPVSNPADSESRG